MIALYDFKAVEEPEITMNKGDSVEMLDMDPALNGWAYARLKKNGNEGYVPVSYLGTSINNRFILLSIIINYYYPCTHFICLKMNK